MDKLEIINVLEIEPDPNQPRKDFDQEGIQELANSILAVGVITPITVRKHPSPNSNLKFMIVAGERRWRASKQAGLVTIPAIIISDQTALSEDDIFAHQLTENLHRAELNPVEKAEFINGRIEYLKTNGISNAIEKVAEELGVSPSWVSKNTAILKYAPEIRALARDGYLRDYAAMKKIAKLKGDKRKEAIDLIYSGAFSAKEYFGPKRRKRVVGESGSNAGLNEATNKEKHHLSLFRDEWIRLIEKTDYVALLNHSDSGWRNATTTVFKQYINQFKQWVSADQ